MTVNEEISLHKLSECEGYLHPEYSSALSEFGDIIELPKSGGWLLKRRIPGTDAFDATGGYPYFVCHDWKNLSHDLDSLDEDLVSVAVAPDPFGDYDQDLLRSCFPDLCIHFKDHCIADLSLPLEQIISRRHIKQARKALEHIQVEFCTEPMRYLDEWVDLFEFAISRFGLKGIRAFSRASFSRHFTIPGVVMSLARYEGKVIAGHVQIIKGDVVYAHLAGAKPDANRLGASYALYYAEIEFYRDIARWIDWGGDAGVRSGNNNLSSFKRGWSTGVKPAYFCGRIYDRKRYDAIVERQEPSHGSYFPAYRHGEFA